MSSAVTDSGERRSIQYEFTRARTARAKGVDPDHSCRSSILHHTISVHDDRFR